jgi:hypothetical protein
VADCGRFAASDDRGWRDLVRRGAGWSSKTSCGRSELETCDTSRNCDNTKANPNRDSAETRTRDKIQFDNSTIPRCRPGTSWRLTRASSRGDDERASRPSRSAFGVA